MRRFMCVRKRGPLTENTKSSGVSSAQRPNESGQQPGDQEDLAGHPFVGPAGKVLDRAMAEAGLDGRDTKVGVRLGPDMRDPTSGLNHLPEKQHLRDGVKGEQELANRIQQFNPREKIIHFSPAAGMQEPDIMSVSEKGEVAFWDSKYRNREQSIPPSRRTNPSEKSLSNFQDTEKYLREAVDHGILSKELAAKAMANLITGNFLLCTVGMGQAHQGVVEIVRDGRRTGPL